MHQESCQPAEPPRSFLNPVSDLKSQTFEEEGKGRESASTWLLPFFPRLLPGSAPCPSAPHPPGLRRRPLKFLEGPQWHHWVYGEMGVDPAFQGGQKERGHAGHIGFDP